MALDLGELTAKLKADPSGLDRGLEEGQSKLGKFGKVAGAGLAGAGLAAGAMFAGALSSAIDQEAVADVAAAAYANPEQAKQAGDIAGKLYAGGWGEGLADVNEAVGSVLNSIGEMGDASDADIQSMTAKVMDLSKVMGIEVPRAAQVVGQAVKSGLAEDATQGVDLLTKALQIVPTNLREDLMDAVDEYGPFLSSVGITGERAFGTLAHAAEKGMYGIDKTGDAIKEFTLRATDGSKSTTGAFQAIGLNADQMARGLSVGGEAGAKAFQKTVKGLLDIEDPAKRAQTAIALFGTPLEDLNVSEIPKFLESLDASRGSMGGFEGAAQKLSDTVNDNAATAIESFKRQATQTFVSVLGGSVLPMVTTFVTFLANNLGPTLRDIGSWIQTNVMPWLRQFGDFIAGRVIPAVQRLAGEVLAYARQQLAGLARTFQQNRPQIQSFVAWIKQASVWVGQHLVPIMRVQLKGAIQTAIGIIKAVIQVISTMVKVVQNVTDQVKTFVRMVRNGTHDVLQAFRGMGDSVNGILRGIGDKMYNAGANMLKMIASGIRSQASAAYNAMKDAVAPLTKLLPGSPVREGPLKVLNNGKAGRLIAGMLAAGIIAGKNGPRNAFTDLLSFNSSGVRGGYIGRAPMLGTMHRRDANAYLTAKWVGGSPSSLYQELLKGLRLELRKEGMGGVLG